MLITDHRVAQRFWHNSHQDLEQGNCVNRNLTFTSGSHNWDSGAHTSGAESRTMRDKSS